MLKQSNLARAITLAFSAGALSFGLHSTALAQSNTTGNVYGEVASPAGATVVVENLDTKLRRTVNVEASGRFLATSLPPGRYSVQMMRNGKVEGRQEVEVLIGQGAEANFAAAVQSVTITSRRQAIDVSNTNNGAVFTATQLAKLPVARNVESIILIAPNTTAGDSRYAAGASFGGGAVSENSYYVNGFPVTNPLTQLGFMELPFGAIGQAQILTGGFGAEFGRSVGGVANITTRSGTNRWEVGATVQWEPKSMQASQDDIYYEKLGASNTAATDGTLYRRRQDNRTDRKLVGVNVGGPIIQDQLFFFGSLEQSKTDFEGTNATNGLRTNTSSAIRGWEESETKTTRYLVKLDWNINDNHRVEYTGFGDTSKKDKYLSGYNYTTGARNNVTGASEHYKNFGGETPVGGIVNILKYTGNLTDDLTLTALYGRATTKHENTYGTYPGVNPNVYQVVALNANRVPAIAANYVNPNPITGNVPMTGGRDKVESARLDLEYKWGKHTFRAGVDENRLSSVDAGLYRAGGGLVPLVPAPFSANNEYFQAKHPKTIAATNLDPTFQDEMTIGFERALTPDLSFGARATYRTLKSTIDDMCDNRPVLAWLARNPGINTTNWTGFGCAAFNPGEDNTFLVDFSNTGNNLTEVKLSAADLGYEKAKRTYKAIDLFVEHPLRNGWYGKVNYTWSKNEGNTEGQTQSETGQGDVSHTLTWDKPEIMRGKYGPLPNDRTHQLKAFGFYQVAPEWTVGGNLLAQSGRPKNCLGADPTVPAAHHYGSVYMWCAGTARPRGSEGRLPWTTRLDLNVAYAPSFVPGLTAKIDVFNIMNRQTVQSVIEQYNVGATQTVSDIYGRTLSTQNPRYARFTLEYNRKF